MTENQQDTYTEDELAIKREVEIACMNAIVAYLTEVADAMSSNGMIALTVTDIRAMASTIQSRIG